MTGRAPTDWFVDSVSLQKAGGGRPQGFQFNQWIAPRRSATRSVIAVRFRLIVRTTDRWRAGTDARVRFVLRGSEGALVKVVDRNVRSRSERDRVDIVELSGREIGLLRSIEVSHDRRGSGSGWHLDSIRVEPVGASSRTFSFRRWIDGPPVRR